MSEITRATIKRGFSLRYVAVLETLIERAQHDPSKVEEVRTRVEGLQDRISSFEQSHLQIMSHASNADNQDALYTEFDEFHEAICRIKLICSKPPFKETEHLEHSEQSATLTNTFSTNASGHSSCYAKLPKLNLPTFSGLISEWSGFYDMFMSTIDSHDMLQPVQKFQYLKSCLQGEPLTLIRNLPLTDANYGTALQILKDRYARKRLISAFHLQSLINLLPPSPMTYENISKFVSSVREHVAALKANGEPVDSWSRLIAFLLSDKLDTSIRNRFEGEVNSDQLPELDALLKFLDTYIVSQQWQTVCPISSSKYNTSVKGTPPSKSKQINHRSAFITTLKSSICPLCKESHILMTCAKFQRLAPNARLELARSHKLCRNCLSPIHHTANCQSKVNCRICHQRHHTLLHIDRSSASSSTPSTQISQPSTSNDCVTTSTDQPQSTVNITRTPPPTSTVLLGTAIINVQASTGLWKPVRALLDSGSEATYITSRCLEELNLPCKPTTLTISGFSNTIVNTVKGTTSIRFRSRIDKNSIYAASAIVVSHITSTLPKQPLPSSILESFKDLTLADPTFYSPASVDMLIGADLYAALLTGHKSNLTSRLAALETSLGWIITGSIPMHSDITVNTLHATVQDPILLSLSKFWEIEEIPSKKHLSPDDERAEKLFEEHHSRDTRGRYIVPLLFKDFPPVLGDSYHSALRSFISLRNRLRNNEPLRSAYVKFMQEYLDSGHMSLDIHSTQNDGYFLPHHGILKQNSSMLKLRVVFNGSHKTTFRTSLNDALYTGPALQTDLSAVVMRSRVHRIMFTADIRHMYRQILIQDSHRSFQKILWNFDIEKPPQIYQLNTVTYGTSCAPYLALRTLRQLAADEGDSYPHAAQILSNDTYVDDIVTGADTVQKALQLKHELITLLSKAGLTLHKWASNHPSLINTVNNTDQQHAFPCSTNSDTVKLLGIVWDSRTDAFLYQLNLSDHPCTKRSILSNIAKIFDPLGWLTPIVMLAKRLMQEIWTLGTDWDTPVPESITDQWNKFQGQLEALSMLSIPRFVDTSGVECNLVGFCDASEVGYAAVIYLHTTSSDGRFHVSMLSAKSRVAPLKRLSLPRLELCAALLLSRLITHFLEYTHLKYSHIDAWSDSSVALSWIRSPPYKWKTFVSNRVAEIQQNTPSHLWNHVRSKDNPADCASRGIFPHDLVSHSLWWSGPSWLHQPRRSWPFEEVAPDSTATVKEELTTSSLIIRNDEVSLLDRFSDLDRLLRITSLCLRFLHTVRQRRSHQSLQHNVPAFITASELDNALLTWIHCAQRDTFQREINQLEQHKLCLAQIQRLNPFLDDTGLIRVGGRLKYARIHLDQKHPLLLPSKHRLTELIITQYHLRYLHPSPRTLQALIERRFWILGARRLIRSHTRKCLTCFKCRPVANNPLMGNLPAHRVIQLKPFASVGVDYGGPFHITAYKHRGAKTIKAYLCLFVCFSTKALHLELASDLSTDAFLAAFRRFLARRGRCSHIYSDAGTNFIGAKRYFSELQRFVASSSYNEHLNNRLASEGIEWHLNPPAAPHFGGLWESSIKSVKFHIQRVVGMQLLTFEEFYTILCQVESILNSRPLCPLSSDPNDLTALTPNHFITQESAVCLPEPDLGNVSYLTRWQLLQRLQQDFWKRWHAEFLGTLQHRAKWHTLRTNITVGTLVLIKDAQLPPLQWKLGRIAAVHPGGDGIVRVADVITSKGTISRPVIKLCPLPLAPN